MSTLPPAWVTAAGLIGTITENFAVSGLQVVANDPQNLPLSYSLLNGSLPPGISLLASGSFTGSMSAIPNVPNPPTPFSFTVRATNGTFSIDRQFSINGFELDSAPVWNFASFPAANSNPPHEFPLATLDRGAVFTFPLDITDADFDTLVFSISAVPAVLGARNGFLPPGLVLNQQARRIEGTTTFDTTVAGTYFFRITVNDVQDPRPDKATNPAPVDCSITLTNDVAASFQSPLIIAFTTPAGSLGSLIETYPSYFGIAAASVIGDASDIVYTLAPNSGPLPPGLTLNATSGAISGVASFVTSTTTHAFTGRAQNGNTFVDRDFAITVVSRFNAASIYDFRCALLGPTRRQWFAYYAGIISAAALFQPSDPNFGVPQQPTIYIIKGITRTSAAALADALDGAGSPDGKLHDFHHNASVLLGTHKIAVARDANNNLLYEVLYREIIDPQALGGGFSLSSLTPIDQPVTYPQANAQITTVYPNSFHNLRYDLIDDLGLAGNGVLAKLPGPSGIEGMPLWMMSRQDAADSNSIIGYVPAIEIAYLNPGYGARVLRQLQTTLIEGSTTQTQDSFLAGHNVPLDRYLITSITFDTAMHMIENFVAFPHS